MDGLLLRTNLSRNIIFSNGRNLTSIPSRPVAVSKMDGCFPEARRVKRQGWLISIPWFSHLVPTANDKITDTSYRLHDKQDHIPVRFPTRSPKYLTTAQRKNKCTCTQKQNRWKKTWSVTSSFNEMVQSVAVTAASSHRLTTYVA